MILEIAASTPVAEGEMTVRAHVAITVMALVGIGIVIRLVRRANLKSKYVVLWLSASAAIVVLVALPRLLGRISSALGIYYPPATFLAIAVGVLFLISVQFSSELSRSDERIRKLAEELALLRERVSSTEEDSTDQQGPLDGI